MSCVASLPATQPEPPLRVKIRVRCGALAGTLATSRRWYQSPIRTSSASSVLWYCKSALPTCQRAWER